MQQSRVIPSPRSFACDLATLCAPTLAGLKPASLFRYQPAPGQDAADMAAAWHAALSPRGVTVRVLRQCPRTGAVLVYVYRPARVARLLAAPHMLDFLAGEGYTPGTADERFSGLPAGGCHRVHPKPRQKLYRMRLLEGLHRPHRCTGRV